MKTIVCQSFRTTDVPRWINRCLQSVEAWAKANVFDYELVDDRLFDYISAELFHKMKQHKGAASNLARLELIKKHLNSYERAIWIDADVIVFDPDRFTIDITEEYAFCREIWLYKKRKLFRTRIICKEAVNNAVTVFTRNNSFLDFFIESCHAVIMKKSESFQRWDIGTTFLTALHSIVPFSLLTNIGLFSPTVIEAILRGQEDVTEKYIKAFRHHIVAANLCASCQGHKYEGFTLDESAFNKVIDILLATKGNVVNRYLP